MEDESERRVEGIEDGTSPTELANLRREVAGGSIPTVPAAPGNKPADTPDQKDEDEGNSSGPDAADTTTENQGESASESGESKEKQSSFFEEIIMMLTRIFNQLLSGELTDSMELRGVNRQIRAIDIQIADIETALTTRQNISPQERTALVEHQQSLRASREEAINRRDQLLAQRNTRNSRDNTNPDTPAGQQDGGGRAGRPQGTAPDAPSGSPELQRLVQQARQALERGDAMPEGLMEDIANFVVLESTEGQREVFLQAIENQMQALIRSGVPRKQVSIQAAGLVGMLNRIARRENAPMRFRLTGDMLIVSLPVRTDGSVPGDQSPANPPSGRAGAGNNAPSQPAPRGGAANNAPSQPAPRGGAGTPPERSPERPDRTRRIALTERGEDWVEERQEWIDEYMEDPDSSLRERALEIDVGTAVMLDALDGESGGGITFNKLPSGAPGQQYAFKKGSETWYVMQDFSRSTDEMVIRLASDPLTQIGVAGYAFGSSIDFAEIGDAMETAKERRTSERADEAGMKDFDLPKNERIGYIGLYDVTDPTEASQIEHFPGMMNQQGYNFVSDGDHIVGVDRNPVDILRSNVQNMYEQGVRNFYISMSVHGDTQSISFTGPDGRSYHTEPSELQAMYNQFSDAKFTLSLNACEGGGFNAADYTDSGESGRITTFVQAKPELLNTVFRQDGSRVMNTPRGAVSTEFASAYDSYLMKYIGEGMPYGQAHLRADRRVKEIFPGMDAGVFRSGRRGGVQTASVDTPSTPPDPTGIPPDINDPLSGMSGEMMA